MNARALQRRLLRVRRDGRRMRLSVVLPARLFREPPPNTLTALPPGARRDRRLRGRFWWPGEDGAQVRLDVVRMVGNRLPEDYGIPGALAVDVEQDPRTRALRHTWFRWWQATLTEEQPDGSLRVLDPPPVAWVRVYLDEQAWLSRYVRGWRRDVRPTPLRRALWRLSARCLRLRARVVDDGIALTWWVPRSPARLRAFTAAARRLEDRLHRRMQVRWRIER